MNRAELPAATDASPASRAPRRGGSPWHGIYVQCTFLLVLLFGLIVVAPLLQPGYFWGAHDARHDVYFIFQYDKSVQDGIWFPRWSPDWTFGYGYPFFIVYGPLATFVGELFHHFLGLGYENSVKAVLGLSILLSGLAMYGFARSWLGRNAALVAAVAYMAIPYHLVDVFVRAAMAESVALVFLPLVLWGFRETVTREGPRPPFGAVLGAAVAYAAIMWTSNLVAVVFTPALALYVLALILWRARDEGQSLSSRPGNTGRAGGEAGAGTPVVRRIARAALAPAIAFGLGLGLSAAFFVPAMVEQGYINKTQWFGQYYDPTRHFVYFHQLFNPTWGFGISQPGPNDIAQGAMSYQLGAAVVVLSLIVVAFARRARGLRRELGFWAVWAVASISLTLSISAPLWRHAPLIPYAQFPWRYLMLAILPLSILPGAVVALGSSPAPDDAQPQEEGSGAGRGRSVSGSSTWPAIMLAGLILLSSYPYFKVQNVEPTPDQGPVSYEALMRFQRTSDEMTGVTAWVDPALRPNWSPMAELWVQGQKVTTRVDYSQVPQNETLAVNSEDLGSAHEQVYFYAKDPGQSITFNWFWYPGWTAYLLDHKDGRPVEKLPVEREAGPLARIVAPVPAGEGYILLRMEDTPLRAAAKWITYATVAVILVGLLVVYVVARGKRRLV